MSKPKIVEIRADLTSSPPIYVFKFSDDGLVAVAETTSQKYTKYDGCEFHAWDTNEEFFENTTTDITVSDLPFGLTTDNVFVEGIDPDYVEIIEAFSGEA